MSRYNETSIFCSSSRDFSLRSSSYSDSYVNTTSFAVSILSPSKVITANYLRISVRDVKDRKRHGHARAVLAIDPQYLRPIAQNSLKEKSFDGAYFCSPLQHG